MTLSQKLTKVAENMSAVHEAGKKTQNKQFWENVKSSIYAGGYSYAFAGKAWTSETFKPTFDIAPTGSANSLFYASFIGNIKQSLEDCGVRLDLSSTKNATNIFNVCETTALPEIDLRNCAQHQYVFAYSSKLKTIDKVRFAEGVAMTGCFTNCSSLTHVIFDGTISGKDLDMKYSKSLDKASITSLINALSEETSGLSVTLSEAAVNKAFETGLNKNDGKSSAEWTALCASRSNWNIVTA